MTGPGRILLASTSPRRIALLRDAGMPFRCVEPGPEPEEDDAPPQQLAEQRAVAKAVGARESLAGGQVLPGDLILGVDTVVEVAGASLGKPRSRTEAESILRSLAVVGQHRVHSAHCMLPAAGGPPRTEVATAVVSFDPEVDGWLPGWLDSGLWQGKAGGYGIQDEAAGFARLVAGELDTVVGMSLAAVRRLQLQLGKGGES